MLNSILIVLLGAIATFAEWPGPIKSDIDSIGKGTPDKPRFADNMPVYPGSRCGENFGLRPPPVTNGLNTNAMLCVGRPTNDAKEQDGDSGGPVFIKVGGVHVQIGVNTGSYPADEFRSSGTAAGNPGDSHIGYYTRVDWPTIKPWLTKILAGDFVGAKAMTCAELGGKTSPNPNPGNRRLSKSKTKTQKVKVKTKTKNIRRDLISGDGASTATDGQFPSLVTQGNYYDIGGSKVWEPGCDGTLIKSNVYLAAAHCFTSTEMKTDRNQMRVWPGAWNLANPEPSASKFRFATEIIRHPCYTMPTNYPACLESQPNCNDDSKPMEDIAVAILASDASSGTAVTPLLGQGTYASTTLTFPVMGTIAGWGRYCDPKADSDPSKCTMKDWNIPLDPSKGVKYEIGPQGGVCSDMSGFTMIADPTECLWAWWNIGCALLYGQKACSMLVGFPLATSDKNSNGNFDQVVSGCSLISSNMLNVQIGTTSSVKCGKAAHNRRPCLCKRINIPKCEDQIGLAANTHAPTCLCGESQAPPTSGYPPAMQQGQDLSLFSKEMPIFGSSTSSAKICQHGQYCHAGVSQCSDTPLFEAFEKYVGPDTCENRAEYGFRMITSLEECFMGLSAIDQSGSQAGGSKSDLYPEGTERESSGWKYDVPGCTVQIYNDKAAGRYNRLNASQTEGSSSKSCFTLWPSTSEHYKKLQSAAVVDGFNVAEPSYDSRGHGCVCKHADKLPSCPATGTTAKKVSSACLCGNKGTTCIANDVCTPGAVSTCVGVRTPSAWCDTGGGVPSGVAEESSHHNPNFYVGVRNFCGTESYTGELVANAASIECASKNWEIGCTVDADRDKCCEKKPADGGDAAGTESSEGNDDNGNTNGGVGNGNTPASNNNGQGGDGIAAGAAGRTSPSGSSTKGPGGEDAGPPKNFMMLVCIGVGVVVFLVVVVGAVAFTCIKKRRLANANNSGGGITDVEMSNQKPAVAIAQANPMRRGK